MPPYTAAGPEPAYSEPESNNLAERSRLAAMAESINVAEMLDEAQLSAIGAKVLFETQLDESSRKEWWEKTEEYIKLAAQLADEKTHPWPKAANVLYPELTAAAVQFNARAYPAIVTGQNVVKGQVVGPDPHSQKRARADRMSLHMNYQILTEMPEWEEDTDRLTLQIVIVGCLFRKTWWNAEKGRPNSELCLPEDIIVNHKAKSLETVPRVTHRIWLYPYEVEERRRDGRFLDVALMEHNEEEGQDEDAAIAFLEQHRWLDLDEDGYPEPWIVVVEEASGAVVRITPRFDPADIVYDGDRIIRIPPTNYFTKYGFIPNPDGGFYDVGLGALLGPLNATINSTINQLLDAGTLQNAGGGAMARTGGKVPTKVTVSPGKWTPVEASGMNLRDMFFPWPNPGPSAVSFSLLELMLGAAKDISGLKDVLTGDIPAGGANMPATTVLALIEQGQKQFSAIYKRIHRALKHEFAKIRRLNRLYLEPERYQKVIDWQPAALVQPMAPGPGGVPPTPTAGAANMVQVNPPYVSGTLRAGDPVVGPQPAQQPPTPQEDYADEDCDIVPVSDPSSVSDMQKGAKAQFLLQSFMGHPLVNQEELVRRAMEAVGVDGIDELVMPPQPAPPNPEILKLQLEAQKAQMDAQLKQMELQVKAAEIQAKAQGEAQQRQLDAVATGADIGVKRADIALKTMQAVKAGQEAEAVQPGLQLEKEKLNVQRMQKESGNGGGTNA